MIDDILGSHATDADWYGSPVRFFSRQIVEAESGQVAHNLARNKNVVNP
jgi:hypothetical protein